MNAEVLLKHFRRISEAPEAIPRLRRFVLELGARGKLVEQHLKDRVNDCYLHEPCSDTLPSNWRLLSFATFCDIQGGNQPPKSKFVHEPQAGYVRLFQIRDLGENPVPTYIPLETTHRFCRDGDILIGRYGASVGKVFWAQTGAYNVALAKFIYPEDAFIPQFAFLVLKSDLVQAVFTGATRSAQAGFNKGDLGQINFPLPPLAEQQRIIAKVDELMGLCDQLDEAQRKRTVYRNQLTSSSIHQLCNYSDGYELHESAKFFINHLPKMTTDPSQLPSIRKAVLTLALRGRLLPQDPSDIPASELLRRIHAQRFGSTSSSKRTGDVEVRDTGILGGSQLPASWRWTTLGTLAEGLRYGTSTKCSYEPFGVPVLRIPNVECGRINTDDLKFGPLGKREVAQLKLQLGDILMVRSNGSLGLVGRPALVEAPAVGMCYAGYLVRVRPFANSLSSAYLVLALNSCHVRSQIEKPIRTAVGLKNVNAKELSALIVPLPPFAEQERIVARVNELMSVCDQLEVLLTVKQNQSQGFLDAVLYEALNGETDYSSNSVASRSIPSGRNEEAIENLLGPATPS